MNAIPVPKDQNRTVCILLLIIHRLKVFRGISKEPRVPAQYRGFVLGMIIAAMGGVPASTLYATIAPIPEGSMPNSFVMVTVGNTR